MLLKLSLQNISFLETLPGQSSSPVEYLLMDFIKHPNDVNLYWPVPFASGDYPVELHPLVITLMQEYYSDHFQKSVIDEKHFISFLSAVINFRIIRYKRLASKHSPKNVKFIYNRKYLEVIEQYEFSRLARWAAAIDNFKQRGLFSLNLTTANIIESWCYTKSASKQNGEKLNWLLFKLWENKPITKKQLFGTNFSKEKRTKKNIWRGYYGDK